MGQPQKNLFSRLRPDKLDPNNNDNDDNDDDDDDERRRQQTAYRRIFLQRNHTS